MSSLVLPDDNAEAWINALPDSQQNLVQELLRAGLSELEAAEFWLSRSGSDATLGFSSGSAAQRYFEAVKAEFSKLVCGGDGYDGVRKDFARRYRSSPIPRRKI